MLNPDTLRERAPGEALILEVLRHQQAARPRTAIDRLLGRSPLTADAMPWYVGAQGEIEVGAILAQLPAEWTALHSVPTGSHDADIDHIVIGPGGVFTINTKHHRGKEVWVAGQTLLVSGQRQPYIWKAQREADVVAEILAAAGIHGEVKPVLAIVGARSITLRGRPDSVRVIDANQLQRWLRRRRPVLSADAVREITRVLESPAMWRPAPPLEHRGRVAFAALEREVRSARVVRMAWALLPGGAVLAVAVPSLLSSVGMLLQSG